MRRCSGPSTRRRRPAPTACLLYTSLSSRLLGEGLAQTLAGYLRAIPMPDTQGIANALLVPLFAYYLLKDRERIRQGALYLIPGCWRGDVTRIMERVHRGLTGYLRGQLWVALFVGLLTGAGLYLSLIHISMACFQVIRGKGSVSSCPLTWRKICAKSRSRC